jgi:hypothetical protein
VARDAHANGRGVFEQCGRVESARARVAALQLLVVQRLRLRAKAFEQVAYLFEVAVCLCGEVRGGGDVDAEGAVAFEVRAD